MIDFKMTTQENFASFIDPKTGVMVFIDSFDNQEFNVRSGDLLKSKSIGIIKARNNKILNEKLRNIYRKEYHLK